MASVSIEAQSVVQPLLLSHGTLMSRNLANSRRFYEEFLGLEVVRHARPAMMLRLRSGMYAEAQRLKDVYGIQKIQKVLEPGVGMPRGRFLQPGEAVKLWIEGIGELNHSMA